MRIVSRFLKWLAAGALVLVVLLVSPIAYVEALCRGGDQGPAYQPLISEIAWQRKEANSYLSYPEWHIVYAYEDLARVLQTDDEHAFKYLSSIGGFWASFCRLNRQVDRHGGADFDTRATIYTIGISFTLEMGLKALYEETLGRLSALMRGSGKAPQDRVAADMARDYAKFLQQTPWYRYPFDDAVMALWEAPMTSTLRGWERRLALGGEWKAKAAYAKIIENAVAMVGPAELQIRTVVTGIEAPELTAMQDVTIVKSDAGQVTIETPRYRRFTNVLKAIAERGGTIIEIAGNDDVLVSIQQPAGVDPVGIVFGTVLAEVERGGFGNERVLIDVNVRDLAALINSLGKEGRALEHVYDY